MSTLSIPVARVFHPLLSNDYRYYGAHGGRGSGKSHFFAEQVLLRVLNGERWVCIREVQRSIKDSVKQLIEDKIQQHGLGKQFHIVEGEIRNIVSGGLIVFRGMQSYNAENIKSLEDFDGAWVEEGQTLSQYSLDLLRPTLRKKSSKIFCSWNPRFKTDAVDIFFRKSKRPDAICVEANWDDNPWFMQTALPEDLRQDYENDPIKAEHIWGGAYGIIEGSILGRHVSKARREGRINDSVEYDRNGAPIVISSDIGFRDTSSWWFWQPVVGGFKLVAYDGDSGLDANEWIDRLQSKLIEMGAKLSTIWLPQDARAKTFQSQHTAMEKFVSAFGVGKIKIVPQTTKSDQINAAREVINRCVFNAKLCEDGIDGLEAWEYEYNYDLSAYSKAPKHNWASHPSDAFAYGCVVMQQESIKPALGEQKFAVKGNQSGRIVTATVDDLWQDITVIKERY